MVAEQPFDLLALVHAEEAVVDEDAGQLLADRLVDQHRGDGAVDAARQAAQHALVADQRANLGDLGRAELGHRPFAAAAADKADEIRSEEHTSEPQSQMRNSYAGICLTKKIKHRK